MAFFKIQIQWGAEKVRNAIAVLDLETKARISLSPIAFGNDGSQCML